MRAIAYMQSRAMMYFRRSDVLCIIGYVNNYHNSCRKHHLTTDIGANVDYFIVSQWVRPTATTTSQCGSSFKA